MFNTSITLKAAHTAKHVTKFTHTDWPTASSVETTMIKTLGDIKALAENGGMPNDGSERVDCSAHFAITKEGHLFTSIDIHWPNSLEVSLDYMAQLIKDNLAAASLTPTSAT